MPEANEFHYVRSARTDGWRVLLTFLLIAVLFWLGIRVLAPSFPQENPSFFTFFTIVFILAGLALILGYALPHILSENTFVFTITAERVICRCTRDYRINSFNLSLDALLTVEYFRKPNGSEEWYLVTCDGKRLTITSRYGNPVDEIVRTLVHLRPELRPDRV